MSEAVPFIELPVSYRVMAIEEVRERLRELSEKAAEKVGGEPPPGDLALSSPAEVWLKRLRLALSDPACTTASVAEMDAAMREALPEAEGAELQRRLHEFAAIRDEIPHGATKASDDVLLAVLEGLVRRAEAAA